MIKVFDNIEEKWLISQKRLTKFKKITSINKNKSGQRQLLHWQPMKFNVVKSLWKDDALGAFLLLSSYWRAHLVESYCKVSNISDSNWPRYLFSSYLNKIWLSVWRHQLANLHILKTWISVERKEIFENSKQHFSSHKVYLFMFQNGLDWKDAIFVIVPLSNGPKLLTASLQMSWLPSLKDFALILSKQPPCTSLNI